MRDFPPAPQVSGNKDLLDLGSPRKRDYRVDERLWRDARAQLEASVNPEPMEFQIAGMILSDPRPFHGFVQANQYARPTSKPAFSKTGINDRPPKSVMNDERSRACNGEQQNGASRKILADFECERRTCKQKKCPHPQRGDFSDLQTPIHQRAWIIKTASSKE